MNHVQTLSRYKAWANDLLYSAVAELPERDVTAARSIVFGSILRTLNHVYAMDHVWKAHLQGNSHGLTTRNPEACPPLDELSIIQRDIDRWYIDYVDSLPATKFNESVAFTFIGGGTGSMSREAIVLHVVNHATYHRGHIAAMMCECSTEPPTTDFPVFLRSGCI